jgi:hypothetical protein
MMLFETRRGFILPRETGEDARLARLCSVATPQ